jgi:hypothetical protein
MNELQAMSNEAEPIYWEQSAPEAIGFKVHTI